MTHIKTEGKLNDNSYLIDAEFFKLKGTLALYLLENNESRLMYDVGEILSARKLVKKLKNLDLFPIQKIVLSHAHWDHYQAVPRLKKLMKEYPIEIIAHQNAKEILEHPEEMNEYFGYIVDPLEEISFVKEGDMLNLDGFELEVIELFGHTQDSVALFDKVNKSIFVGDAIIDMIDFNTFSPVLYGPHFNEESLLNSYKKLRNMKDEIESIAFSHFGVYTGEDATTIIMDAEDLYFKAKNGLIEWYNENPDPLYVSEKFLTNLIPNSELFTKETIAGLEWTIVQNIDCLKAAGFIK